MTIIDIARLLGEERKARAVTYLFLRKMQGENVADAQAGADEQHAVKLAVLEAKYELLKNWDVPGNDSLTQRILERLVEDSHDDPDPNTDQEPFSTTATASDTDGAGPDCGD